MHISTSRGPIGKIWIAAFDVYVQRVDCCVISKNIANISVYVHVFNFDKTYTVIILVCVLRFLRTFLTKKTHKFKACLYGLLRLLLYTY